MMLSGPLRQAGRQVAEQAFENESFILKSALFI